jgi:hypothetical protein
MYRRGFLQSGVASGLACLAAPRNVLSQDDPSRFPPPPPLSFRDEKSGLRITRVRSIRLVPTRPVPSYEPTPGSWNTKDVEIANPLSIYPRFKPRRSLFYADDLGPETVVVETDIFEAGDLEALVGFAAARDRPMARAQRGSGGCGCDGHDDATMDRGAHRIANAPERPMYGTSSAVAREHGRP